MALNYRELMSREADLARELHGLDTLLPDDLHNGHSNFPQLFDNNDDSLFSPDAMFGGANFNTNPVEQPQSNKQSGENKQIFQQYLDSLEINQFIKLHSQFQKNQSKQGTKSIKNLENSLQCTFKPSILKKSTQMAGNLGPSFERLTNRSNQTQKKKSPYQPNNKELKKTYSKERIERLSKPRIMKTEPCENIQPRKQKDQKKFLNPRNSYGTDIATRNKIWQEQKNDKIKKLREQEEANRLRKQSSSFAPRLTEYKGQKGASISQFGKEGIANYFQRVNMAKHRNGKESNKDNSYSNRRDSISPFASTKNLPRSSNNTEAKVEIKVAQGPQQRVKYEDAVKELHKKLMSLNI